MSIKRYFCVTSIFLFLLTQLAFTQISDSVCFVYVSLKGENKIAVYKINYSNGLLDKIYSEQVTGGPASLATDPGKNYLYVAQRSSNTISAYKTDKITGKLTFINSIPAVDNPVYIATDKTGSYLLSAYFGASKAAIYPIGENGELQSTATRIISTATNPHAISTDPSNQFLYITNMTGNKILQYKFDTVTGIFSAMDPSEIVPPEGTGPRHFVFHGGKKIMYVVNETGNSITSYKITNSGVLERSQTISTLPETFSGTNKCADIHITPDNKFLFASNRGHESIASFRIDPETDSLIANGFYNTVSSPREFDIDPTGSFLYVAGETSDNLAYYRIEEGTGMLDSIGCFDVGDTPSWVLAMGYLRQSTDTTLSLNGHNIIKFGSSPNPFKSKTTINYYIEKPSHVKISVYDFSGRLIKKLTDELQLSGFYSVIFNTTDIRNKGNSFLCKLETGYGSSTIKLIRLP